MSTPHDGLGTASGEGQGQRPRRALFDTVLRHGSEERMSTPPSGVDNQTPRSPSPAEPDHVVTINPRVIQPERSAEHVPAEPTEHAWTRTHIDQWSHVTTIEFLEHFMINTDSLQAALSFKWTGRNASVINNPFYLFLTARFACDPRNQSGAMPMKSTEAGSVLPAFW